MRVCRAFGVLFFVWTHCTLATPPTLYSQPAYESPVRADPGDLLLLAGYGFAADDTVVYQAIGATGRLPKPPSQVPMQSTAMTGIAPVVSVRNVPDSLTILLPTVLQTDVSYALWVRNAAGEWSNGVQINDARPLWITPDTVYSTAPSVGLPRHLKVVGRNLHPAPGSSTQVRLVGPCTVVLPADNDNDNTSAIEHYVAKVNLPANLMPGSYAVEVSRDGASWVPVENQRLTVFPDPATPATFNISAYGGCVANDNVDDTLCIAAAIAAAKLNGGGTVAFGPGVWNMSYTGVLAASGPVTYDGLLVPVGVNLVGADASTTVLQRDANWNTAVPNFSLQGNNIIQNITFRDANRYQRSSSAAAMLNLGVPWYRAQAYGRYDPGDVSGVTITHNRFDKPFMAIMAGGLPIDHLVITYNEFGAYGNPVGLNGDRSNIGQPFHIDDSILSFNIFKPGSAIDPVARQGALATSLGAGLRVDFSSNIADGASTDYLYDPANDAKGWRAAFFWTDRGNHEEVLVSQNVATCTGDKAGDGEAITTDGSSFTIGLPAMQPVLSATARTVTIPGPLLLQQMDKTLPGNYFTEHWVQIAAGPGRGQVRRIVSYPVDASGQPVTPVTFTVFPAWDVLPREGSMLVVSREFWQFYIVDNFVDQRQPLCTKANLNEPAGGKIQFYTQTADSVIEGNRQYDTSGINLGVTYVVQDSQLNTGPGVNLESAIEIRGNLINGEYDWASDCSWGGIQVADGASPAMDVPPPAGGYGLSISHNTIVHADGLHGGAIALTRGWFAGPPPGTWDLQDNSLIFANTINDVSGPPAQRVTGPLPYATSPYSICTGDNVPRVGIRALDATVWRTTLSANSCNNVATNLADAGTASQRECTSPPGNSCECPAYTQGGYSGSSALSTVSATYPVAQVAGNLNAIVIGWSDSNSNVTSVTDSAGNDYKLAAGPTRIAGQASQSVYYAAKIAGADLNTVQVKFDAAVQSADVRIAEYAGIETASPLDAAAGASATGSAPVSAWITTANANDLLLVADFVDNGGDNDLPFRIVSTAGPYQANTTAPTGDDIVQIVAFKLAGGGSTNTQALSAPANLSAAASGAQINLTWIAATDNIGVAGYLVERCEGAGCVDFTQIAKVTDTSYSDSGPLTSGASYTYRVRAIDLASLMSTYSNTATTACPMSAGT